MALRADAEDYERRVGAAIETLDAFEGRLVGELDTSNGGFPQWAGHCDWKTLALLADYLIQSVMGASEALLCASFAARTHRESSFSEGFAHKQAWAKGMTPYPLDAQGRRRALTVTQSAESCLFHLGQTLDRLAAAVTIVGGFGIADVARIDWGQLAGIAERGVIKGSPTGQLEPTGTAGRAAQDALLASVLSWQDFGPPDWFTWMRATRNGMTHRSPAVKLLMMTTDDELARVLYRQPCWSELQSLVFGARPPKKPFYDAFVMSAIPDVLDGLCHSMGEFVQTVAVAMVVCWDARAADPAMIVQHGKQWRVVEPTEETSNFPGYGKPVTPKATKNKFMMVSPEGGRRWEAGRVMDDRRSDWY